MVALAMQVEVVVLCGSVSHIGVTNVVAAGRVTNVIVLDDLGYHET